MLTQLQNFCFEDLLHALDTYLGHFSPCWDKFPNTHTVKERLFSEILVHVGLQ